MDTGVPVEVAAGTVGPGGVPLDRPMSLRSASGVLTPLSFQVGTTSPDDVGTLPVAGRPGGGGGGAPAVEDDKKKRKWVWVWTRGGLRGFWVETKDAAPTEEEPKDQRCQHKCSCYKEMVLDAQWVKTGTKKREWSFVDLSGKKKKLQEECKNSADLYCAVNNPTHLKCKCPGEPKCGEPEERTFYDLDSARWDAAVYKHTKLKEKLPPEGTPDSAGKMMALILVCKIEPAVQCDKGK